MRRRAIALFMIISVVLIMVNINPVQGQIYKYQDENGVWHYTDTPVNLPEADIADGNSRNRDTGAAGSKTPGNDFDLNDRLIRSIQPANLIEKACAGTVVVHSGFGKGTGFFINDAGYILTNKHVIRATDKQEASTEKKFDYLYKQSLAGLNKSFKIELADGQTHYVSLVATSDTLDLALLKLAHFRTPFIQPASKRRLPQGEHVYAIGNPINLRHSVAKGIISGYQGSYVKTDAKIYPGNSGGPLVTQSGEVVGINTFKQITHKFEGLGFAISIHEALREFSAYLPAT